MSRKTRRRRRRWNRHARLTAGLALYIMLSAKRTGPGALGMVGKTARPIEPVAVQALAAGQLDACRRWRCARARQRGRRPEVSFRAGWRRTRRRRSGRGCRRHAGRPAPGARSAAGGNFVAHRVAVRVVDDLEVVEVDQQQAELVAVARCTVDLVTASSRSALVEEVGQRVAWRSTEIAGIFVDRLHRADHVEQRGQHAP